MTVQPGITYADLTPREIREMARRGELGYRDTAGMAAGYVQTSFICLPEKYAFDFMLFCQRNPAPQPLIEVLEPGETEPKSSAPGADIRTDAPGYRVWRHGKVEEIVPDLKGHWRGDLVTFLSGGSFSFDPELVKSGIRLRHVEENEQIGSYVSNIPCRPAGVFGGPMAVSMRPIPERNVDAVVSITTGRPEGHGAPVWAGDPEAIGVDLAKPFAGKGMSVREGEVPVFWACGDTALVTTIHAGVDFMLSYVDAGVLVTDVPVDQVTTLYKPRP
jgi:uncharacterized protein YcsI (UPF0317 family)